MIVGRRELGKWFGVSLTALDNWDRAGMPCKLRGTGNVASQYDSADVIEWRVQQLLDRVNGQSESAKERLDRLRGDREEMTIARESGEVVDATEMQHFFGSMVVAARADLLASALSIKAEADARYGIDFDERIVTDHHEQSLARLVGGEDSDQRAAGDGGGVGAVGATAKDGDATVGG